jgi:hypothetical protein
LDAPELGEGKMCVDNGFRIKADDFSFSNWGRSTEADANVTIQTLIDLFGHSAVCVDGPSSECTIRPTTTQKLEEWNNALAGGRCEGLATLSTRFLLKQLSIGGRRNFLLKYLTEQRPLARNLRCNWLMT